MKSSDDTCKVHGAEIDVSDFGMPTPIRIGSCTCGDSIFMASFPDGSWFEIRGTSPSKEQIEAFLRHMKNASPPILHVVLDMIGETLVESIRRAKAPCEVIPFYRPDAG